MCMTGCPRGIIYAVSRIKSLQQLIFVYDITNETSVGIEDCNDSGHTTAQIEVGIINNI